jgi:hypothetical protein
MGACGDEAKTVEGAPLGWVPLVRKRSIDVYFDRQTSIYGSLMMLVQSDFGIVICQMHCFLTFQCWR